MMYSSIDLCFQNIIICKNVPVFPASRLLWDCVGKLLADPGISCFGNKGSFQRMIETPIKYRIQGHLRSSVS